MADITWSDVTDVARDLAGVPPGTQTKILRYVNAQVSAVEFHSKDPANDSAEYVLARSYLAAHFGALYLRGAFGPAGPLTSETEGGVSAGYAFINSMRWPLLMSTTYGQQFARLVGTSPANAGFTT